MRAVQYFRLASIAGAFLVGFWLPVRLIGFVPSAALETVFDLLISITSAINLYLYFYDSGESPRKLQAWLKPDVILDIVCLMPLALIGFLVFNQTPSGILLLNLLTIRHIRKIWSFLDSFGNLQPVVYRLVPLVLTLPLLVHLVSCAWIALGSGTAGLDADPVLTYVKAIYWSFTTLTTVGYGDITAKTIPQMLLTCVIQVMGVGVFGYILSNVAGLLARRDAAREHHMDNLDKIETFMKMHQTPPDLRASIRGYYHYMWNSKRGYQDRTLLEGLPGKIQSELFLHINRSIIDRVPFFKGADVDMLSELMSELQLRVYVPGEKVFRAGDSGDALYFIHSGEVDVVAKTGENIANLTDGAFFGEMALVSDSPRTATVQARTYCDLYFLPRESFKRVTKAYPSFLEHIEDTMSKRRAS